MTEPLALAMIAIAYLLGSIPFGLLIGKKKGVDVRSVGSGNIGATNVARNLGKRLGALVLLLDALKGHVPMLVGRYLVSEGELPIDALFGIGLAAIVGHCFPVWLRFRGGKGVATALGVFLAIDPLVAGIGVLIFAGLYAAFRVASIGSVSAAIAFPMILWALDRPLPLVHLGIAGSAIVVFKHRHNLMRVLRGEEMKV